MESLFTCPPPAALPIIPEQACGERFEQVIRLMLQRKQSTSSFDATTILVEGTWTPLLTDSGNERVVMSPLLNNFLINPGEALTEGGNDNTTINGVRRMLGEGFQSGTFELRNAEDSVREALRKLTSETAIIPGYTNLWVYMVNRFGQIIAKSDGSGVPLYNFFVGGPGTQGFNQDNIQMGTFDLAPRWSEGVKVFTPSFDILALDAPDDELGEVAPVEFSAVAATTLTVTWTADADAVTYVVERSTAANFSGAVSTNVTDPTVTLAVTGLVAATKYYFRVKATAPNYADGPWAVGVVTTDV